jgi:hypothetical protein
MQPIKIISSTICMIVGLLAGMKITTKENEKIKQTSKIEADWNQEVKLQLEQDAQIQDNPRYKSRKELIDEHTLFSIANSVGTSRKSDWVQRSEKEFVKDLRDYGVPDSEIAKFTGHRAKLAEMAGVDLVFRQEMQKERLLFLRNLKETITPEMYEIFSQSEKIKGSVREYTKMEENGFTVSQYLDRDGEVKLHQMLYQHDMHTTDAWDGPLDPLPNPLFGKLAVREHMVQRLNRLQNGLPNLVNSMLESDYQSEVIDTVRQYYENEIAALNRGYISLLDENQLTVYERVERVNKAIEPQMQQIQRQKETGKRVVNSFERITGN